MKRILWLALVLTGSLPDWSSAQSFFVYGAANPVTGGPACSAGGCAATVVPPPVMQAACAPVVGYRSPTVIYVGAGSGYPRPNYYSGWGYGPGYSTYCSPNVIYFGAGQAWAHGYAFRHYR